MAELLLLMCSFVASVSLLLDLCCGGEGDCDCNCDSSSKSSTWAGGGEGGAMGGGKACWTRVLLLLLITCTLRDLAGQFFTLTVFSALFFLAVEVASVVVCCVLNPSVSRTPFLALLWRNCAFSRCTRGVLREASGNLLATSCIERSDSAKRNESILVASFLAFVVRSELFMARCFAPRHRSSSSPFFIAPHARSARSPSIAPHFRRSLLAFILASVLGSPPNA